MLPIESPGSFLLTLVVLIIHGGVDIEGAERDSPRCASFPAETACGNSTHAVVLSADICRTKFPDSKCKMCITPSKLREAIEKFDSCKLREKGRPAVYKSKVFTNSTKRKKIWKRQIRRPNSCKSVESPRPGKVSCRILPGEMTCVGTCASGHAFGDGSVEKELTCIEEEGFWKPHHQFPPCLPKCDPPCQNGGSCLEINRCYCSNEFRGSVCQYPVHFCSITKTYRASSWKCNHTMTETLCEVSCHPPGSFESLTDFNVHVCSLTGDWTPLLPICVRNSGLNACPDPGDVLNGWRETSSHSFHIGSFISYICNSGYKLRGKADLVCMSRGQWSAKKPICMKQAETIEATNLCAIIKTNQASSWKCNHTITETMCEVSCHPPGSHESLTDFQVHVCSPNGVWMPRLPACVKSADLRCPVPEALPNGRTNIYGDTAKPPGTRLTYSCDEGFTLHGDPLSVCQTNGQWSGNTPICVQEFGLDACADPGDVLHAWRETASNSFEIGSVISYTCNGGYTRQGEADLVCVSKGHWSAKKPTCVKHEDHTDAPNVFCRFTVTPQNMEVKLYSPSNNESSWSVEVKPIAKENGSLGDHLHPVGSRIRYRCRSHFYKLYGSEYQTCQVSGIWSGNKPTCVPECGISDTPRRPFIVHGNATAVGQWPWQVAISVSAVNEQKQHMTCGGTLINEKWVITAAHCVTETHSKLVINSQTVTIYTGKYYRDFAKDDVHVQKKVIHQLIVHEDYDFIRFDADIALIELQSPVELTSRVKPICLPTESTTRENIKDGKRGIVTGWGLTEDNKFAETLRESILPVVSHSKCEDSYRDGIKSLTVTENMFCAGYEEGVVDTCIGDSGGPMMFLDESQRPNRWILEGIISWGSGDGCGQSNRFAGFTKVKKFLEWVKMSI